MRTADALAQQLDNLVHLDTQRAPNGIDLTVGAVLRTTGHGQLDFGGGEFRAAPRERLEPVLDDGRDPLETLLVVSRMGCRFKENCRVSRLVILD